MPVDLLRRGKYQPRVDMREDSLTELAESIKAQGVVQPIVVRPVPNPMGTGETEYEIVAGERRWRAAQMAGLQTIPAVIRDIPDESAVAVALIENIQRENLNPIEEARSLHRLIEEFGLTHADAADAVGRSRATRHELAAAARAAAAGARDARAPRARHGPCPRAARARVAGAADRARRAGAQAAVGACARPRAPSASSPAPRTARSRASPLRARPTDPNVRRLEADLAEKLGAAVSIEHGPKGGRVVIRYNGLDELEGILAHIK